jgi:hypothetical protein
MERDSMTAYDDWKLSGPPEADEEDIEATCNQENDDGEVCSFDGKVTAEIYGDRLTWECPNCNGEHEESARDRFEDG